MAKIESVQQDNLHRTMMLDDKFNAQMLKIQTAIEKLQKMPDEFFDVGHTPTESQLMQLIHASEDLRNVQTRLGGLRKSK